MWAPRIAGFHSPKGLNNRFSSPKCKRELPPYSREVSRKDFFLVNKQLEPLQGLGTEPIDGRNGQDGFQMGWAATEVLGLERSIRTVSTHRPQIRPLPPLFVLPLPLPLPPNPPTPNSKGRTASNTTPTHAGPWQDNRAPIAAAGSSLLSPSASSLPLRPGAERS
jgi:hypothetical protein